MNDNAKKNPLTTNRGVTSSVSSHLTGSSVDYYTATTPKDAPGLHWLAIFNTHKNLCLADGFKLKAGNRHGYDCHSINGMTWGYSEVYGYLLQASSHNAQLSWQAVLPSARKVSRIDLAYTFRIPGITRLVRDLYAQARKANPKANYTHITKNRGGDTLYVGARASEQFGRFYDKSATDPEIGEDFYRLEVEFKGKRSLVVAERMMNSMVLGNFDYRYVRDTVIKWFHVRGISLGLEYGDKIIPATVEVEITSDAKKAKWLKTSVSPSLVELTGRGKLELVSKALGLTKHEYRQLAMFAPVFRENGKEPIKTSAPG